MSRHKKSGDVELGQLEGAYDWLAGVEKDYNVSTRCIMVPTTLNARWSVRMVAEKWEAGKEPRIVAQVTQTYPSGGKQTLAGLMLAMAMSLERIVGNWALDVVGETRSAPQEA